MPSALEQLLGPDFEGSSSQQHQEQQEEQEREEEEKEEAEAEADCCPVCLEEYAEGSDWLKELPCAHRFHEDCILRWFRDHTMCPMCRFDCKDCPV